MTLHLIFFSNNFAMQYEEYTSVWKRSFLALLFAFGFGLAILKSSPKVRQQTWIIFYLGLVMPTLIYLLKCALVWLGQAYAIEIAPYWGLYAPSTPPSPYYVAKTAYMGFCAPVLAIALGQIYFRFRDGVWLSMGNLFYMTTVAAIFFLFYKENIKNGMVYGFLFILIFIALIFIKNIKVSPLKSIVLVLVVILISGFFIFKNIQENPSWRTLFSDAKIAVQTTHFPNWQCGSVMGYPNNDLGQVVSVTNYERISWGVQAAKLVAQYPLGYGLIERSFRQRGNQLWPGSCLSQSHSGWLDLALGIGIPGILLIFGSLFSGLTRLQSALANPDKPPQVWLIMSFCVLFSFLLIWCTTEISQRVFFEELIFYLAFSSGVVIKFQQCPINKD
ncbi:O-antigen ligase family protein [Polynucleobacter sp. UB-Tiil-W10]|uniref:O-antigen ligase family protein n=1 Tax=Polynucleobacter sp. UB-Tiil-W10 TaxID=1855648 RepID=UPI001C0DA55E|nr:O-antigen ligase family protein [Polynucleobacter sp. UB-Tiil-W10]